MRPLMKCAIEVLLRPWPGRGALRDPNHGLRSAGFAHSRSTRGYIPSPLVGAEEGARNVSRAFIAYTMVRGRACAARPEPRYKT
jgi:hypothetical protein